ncbi:MAG: hypothetical protein N4A54_14680, partial [Peptostreptococcaceae bacterium]|nr:hypothetical protein [Peptostreptococcaceae bacterium]
MKKNYYSRILSFALASSLMSVPVVFAQETTNEGTLETITIDTNLEEDVIPSHVDLFDLENKTGFIYFNDLNKKEVSMDGVIELFEENKNLFKIENPTLELREVESFTDNLGFTHIKVQQQFNDIPLHGHEYIIHFNNDSEIYAVNGNLDLSVYNKADRGISRDTKLDSDLALAVAKKHIMADSYADNYTVERFLYEENGEYKNTFEVKIPTVEPIGDWTVIIDATNGDVIEASDRLNLAQTEGSGVGVLNDHKTFNTELYNNLYYLYDNSRNGTIIKTYDANNTNYQWSLPGNYVTDKDNVFDSKRQKAAVDAHKYASYVYDFYKDKFGRDSIDGNGMDLVSSVHFKRNYVNAFWWNNQMTYGDGDG